MKRILPYFALPLFLLAFWCMGNDFAFAQEVLTATELQQKYALFPGETESLGDFRLYVRNFYFFSIGAGMLIGVVMMMVGGMIWLTSAGNPGRVSKAKEYIIDSLFGIVLLISAYLVLQVINPNLVDLNRADLPVVAGSGTCTYDWNKTCYGEPQLKNAQTGCFMALNQEGCKVRNPGNNCVQDAEGDFTEKQLCEDESVCVKIGRDGSCYKTVAEVNANRTTVILPDGNSLQTAVGNDIREVANGIKDSLNLFGNN